jgi:hypothetical protein
MSILLEVAIGMYLGSKLLGLTVLSCCGRFVQAGDSVFFTRMRYSLYTVWLTIKIGAGLVSNELLKESQHRLERRPG